LSGDSDPDGYRERNLHVRLQAKGQVYERLVGLSTARTDASFLSITLSSLLCLVFNS
jgi:hypothetical protein